MSSPATDALRNELNAAVAKLEPQIRGLEDLSRVSLSAETMRFVRQEIDDHKRRLNLEQAALAALAALDLDGYPLMPKAEVPPAVFDEMQEQIADLAAAFLEFEVLPQATTLGGHVEPFKDIPDQPRPVVRPKSETPF